MKFLSVSDLHLEFGRIDIQNPGADVLILAGDICEAVRAADYRDFFANCADRFDNVLYVMGNHEHYSGDFDYTRERLEDLLYGYPNVRVLERGNATIDGVTFVGSTLWTDMNKGDKLTLRLMPKMMHDFRCVRHLSPELSAEEHALNVAYIDRQTSEPGTYVVIGHHAPSRQSTHPRYAADVIMNGAFSSDLDAFIAARPQIKVWLHGHTHHSFDYMIGATRIVCNPRGYVRYDLNPEFDPAKIIEIETTPA